MRGLIDWFRGRNTAPPALRNKPGGMAWIRGVNDEIPGSSALNGRAVRTVRRLPDGKWLVEPQQGFLASENFFWEGWLRLVGEVVLVVGIADDWLEPWKEDGVREEDVIALYAPMIQRCDVPWYPVSTGSVRGH